MRTRQRDGFGRLRRRRFEGRRGGDRPRRGHGAVRRPQRRQHGPGAEAGQRQTPQGGAVLAVHLGQPAALDFTDAQAGQRRGVGGLALALHVQRGEAVHDADHPHHAAGRTRQPQRPFAVEMGQRQRPSRPAGSGNSRHTGGAAC